MRSQRGTGSGSGGSAPIAYERYPHVYTALKRLQGEDWLSRTARERGVELSRAIQDRYITYNLIEGPRGWRGEAKGPLRNSDCREPEFLWSEEHQRQEIERMPRGRALTAEEVEAIIEKRQQGPTPLPLLHLTPPPPTTEAMDTSDTSTGWNADDSRAVECAWTISTSRLQNRPGPAQT